MAFATPTTPLPNSALTIPGLPNTQAAIGTPIPGVGNLNDGIRAAGDGIAKTSYVWPKIVVGPRFGAAYDLTGNQRLILRGGGGLFYDRPDGNTVFSIPGNPPDRQRAGPAQRSVAERRRHRRPEDDWRARARDLPVRREGAGIVAVAGRRADGAALGGILDVSYVGNHGYNRLGGLQGGTTVNLNAVDIGAAYLRSNQDTTQTSTVPGANTIDNPLRTYSGLGNINQNTTDFHDTYHSIQANLNRRFRDGFAFGVNYTYSISWTGNTGLQERLQHAPDGTISVRSDQAQYEQLLNNLAIIPHVFKANAVWDTPKAPRSFGNIVGAILNDWQLSGVFSARSGDPYDLSYSYQNNGSAKNLTGSPDYGAGSCISAMRAAAAPATSTRSSIARL